MQCSNAEITDGSIELTSKGATQPKIRLYTPNGDISLSMSSYNMILGGSQSAIIMAPNIFSMKNYIGGEETVHTAGDSFYRIGDEIYTQISTKGITTPVLTQTSQAEKKKNFEKLENALDIVKATDIYKYNLKTQKDGAKKHIGFVIGDSYNYSREITSENNDGADIYSMTAVLYKAVQEQQETIENLLKRIERLEEKNGIN